MLFLAFEQSSIYVSHMNIATPRPIVKAKYDVYSSEKTENTDQKDVNLKRF